jgi:hypothetical protein
MKRAAPIEDRSCRAHRRRGCSEAFPFCRKSSEMRSFRPPPHGPWCRAGFPACRFTALSSAVFRNGEIGHWKVPPTGSLERLPYEPPRDPGVVGQIQVYGFRAQISGSGQSHLNLFPKPQRRVEAVPEGRMTIAQRFSVGYGPQSERESRRDDRKDGQQIVFRSRNRRESTVPPGRLHSIMPHPTLKRWAIVVMSLRDKTPPFWRAPAGYFQRRQPSNHDRRGICRQVAEETPSPRGRWLG